MTQISIDPRTLGERLRIARSEANLTQEASASALGISRTTLVALENGQRRARPEELLKLSEIYRTTVGHLVSTDSIHVDLAAKFRRIESKAREAESASAISMLNGLVSGAIELERAMDMPLRHDYPPALRIAPSKYIQQAEDAAISFRGRVGLGLGRIDDLLSTLELDVGVRVFLRPLDSNISGLYAYDTEVGACILINSNHHWKRRMQSLAHEAGHFVSERDQVDILDDQAGLSVSEKFARRFGGALLMPAPSVRAKFDHLLERDQVNVEGLILLAHQYGVATEAMCRRLEDLELLAEGTWLSLRDRGYKTNLERDVLGDPQAQLPPPLVSPRLTYIAAMAIKNGVLSEGQLCEMLLVDRVQLRRVLRAFPMSEY